MSTDHLDVFGKVEALPEGPRRDAPVQDLGALVLFGVLVAGDEQGVLLLDELDLAGGEARQRHRDAIVVFAGPLDVVGRPVRRRFGTRRLVEHIEQPVEADGRAVEGRKVVGSHDHILLRATWKRERRIPSGTRTQAFTALGRKKYETERRCQEPAIASNRERSPPPYAASLWQGRLARTERRAPASSS